MKYVFVFLGTLSLLAGCAPARRPVANGPSSASAPVQRSEGPALVARSKFLDNGTSLRVYLSIDPGREVVLEDFPSQFAINYTVAPEYGSRAVLQSGGVSLKPGETLFRQGSFYTVFFDVPKPANKDIFTAVLLADINDLTINRRSQQDLSLRFHSGKFSDFFAIFDQTGRVPRLQNYVAAVDTLQLRSLAGKDTTFRAFHYGYEFEAALSPTNTELRRPTRQLFTDSAFSVRTNSPLRLSREGLYFFVRDTTETFGICLLSVDDRYPRVTRPEKLTKPLIYMSTNQEYADANASKEAKKALDRYWINLTSGNQQTAKRSIRAFYRRVEQANRLFTTYKEGWKTDKGMVYLIMGPPNRVQRNKDKEVWVYNRRSAQFSEINFTFNKRANQFVDDHYELSRFVEFQPIWYPAVEAWRNGEVDQ
ncbi:MAG: GWxTD domain-containing protein [Sphingobacteriaceae bacterium]|nr:GWxTD domain-containing protein [Cytophagaceae bacterium]